MVLIGVSIQDGGPVGVRETDSFNLMTAFSLMTEVLYDPAILFMLICPKKLKAGTSTICAVMFIAALFTIANTHPPSQSQ